MASYLHVTPSRVTINGHPVKWRYYVERDGWLPLGFMTKDGATAFAKKEGGEVVKAS